MKKLTIALFMTILLVFPVTVFAQDTNTGGEENVALLEYFEDASGGFKIVTADGEEIYSQDLYFGYEIPVGSTVITEAGDYAEISLDPNGSIIKVAENTNFKLVSLQKTDGSGENAFSVAVGKFRAVAGKLSGNEKYTFKGPSAVCGVRGTDLGMEVLPGQKEVAFVLDGLIEYTNAAGQKVEIGAGMMADALSESFQPIQIPPDMLSNLLKGLEFKKLKPENVPGHKPAPKEEKPKEEVKKAETPPPPPPVEEKKAKKAKEEAKKEVEKGFMSDIYKKLREILGMEIGSVTIDGVTYSKAILQPHFAIGKLKMALYLPIIYKTDMLNPNDWYHPKGNDEWSFGTDQEGFGESALDFLNDLALKIRYIEWGKQRDKFFFKVGNLNDITIGHGLLMRNYANDSDFPSVRRVGLNLGFDFGFLGFESMVNDIGEPEIFGGRLYLRPIPVFPIAVGTTVLTDISPASDLSDEEKEAVGDPMLFNLGFDLDFPFIETDFFSIVSFADIGGMLPVLRSALPDSDVSKGPQWNALIVNDPDNPDAPPSLKNYGIAAGLFGNIAMFNWRVEYRDFNGTFKPAFYNQLYDRQRVTYVTEIANYLKDPNAEEYQHQTLGIFGEGGFAIKKLFSLEAGYFWPWYKDENGEIQMGEEDMLHLKFALEPDVIPVVGIYGSVSYDRTKFIPTLLSGAEEGLSLFDANTVVSAEVIYPVAPTLDVSILYTTTLKRNADGSLDIDPETGEPRISTTISIETKIHF